MQDSLTQSKNKLLNLLFHNLIVFTKNLKLTLKLLIIFDLVTFTKELFKFFIQIYIDNIKN